MTISSEVSSSGPFYGNGATTVFPYAFKIIDETHIRAVLIAANGTVCDLSLSEGDFTITGVGDDAGGTLVKASPLLEGEILTMVRTPPMTQETSLENQGAYYPEVIEARFDLAVMQIQAVREKVDRALAVEPGQPLPDVARLLEAEGAAVGAAALALVAKDDAVAAKDMAVAAAASIDPENFYTKAQIDTQQSTQDTAIAARALASRTITAGDGLTGGGNLTANRALAVDIADTAAITAGTAGKIVDAAGLKAEMTAAGKGRVTIQETMLSAGTAAFIFTDFDHAKYAAYEITLFDVTQSAQQPIILQTSADAGATWHSTATDYAWGGKLQVTNAANNHGIVGTSGYITASGTDAPTITAGYLGIDGVIYIIEPGSAKVTKMFADTIYCRSYDNVQSVYDGYIVSRQAVAVNGLRIMALSGTFSGGKITFRGILR